MQEFLQARRDGLAPGTKRSRRSMQANSLPPTGEEKNENLLTPAAPPESLSFSLAHLPLFPSASDPASLHKEADLSAPSVLRTSRSSLLQRKRVLGPGGDQYEQEADSIASQIPHRLGQSRTQIEGPGAFPRRQSIRAISVAQKTGSVPTEVESGIARSLGGGSPLPQALQGNMERAFGANFQGVRVHTDAGADRLNRSLLARAFTTGQHIFFRRGEYQPTSSEGQSVLAHELTHVVQQSGNTPEASAGQLQQESSREGGPALAASPSSSSAGLIQCLSDQIRRLIDQKITQTPSRNVQDIAQQTINDAERRGINIDVDNDYIDIIMYIQTRLSTPAPTPPPVLPPSGRGTAFPARGRAYTLPPPGRAIPPAPTGPTLPDPKRPRLVPPPSPSFVAPPTRGSGLITTGIGKIPSSSPFGSPPTGGSGLITTGRGKPPSFSFGSPPTGGSGLFTTGIGKAPSPSSFGLPTGGGSGLTPTHKLSIDQQLRETGNNGDQTLNRFISNYRLDATRDRALLNQAFAYIQSKTSPGSRPSVSGPASDPTAMNKLLEPVRKASQAIEGLISNDLSDTEESDTELEEGNAARRRITKTKDVFYDAAKIKKKISGVKVGESVAARIGEKGTVVDIEKKSDTTGNTFLTTIDKTSSKNPRTLKKGDQEGEGYAKEHPYGYTYKSIGGALQKVKPKDVADAIYARHTQGTPYPDTYSPEQKNALDELAATLFIVEPLRTPFARALGLASLKAMQQGESIENVLYKGTGQIEALHAGASSLKNSGVGGQAMEKSLERGKPGGVTQEQYEDGLKRTIRLFQKASGSTEQFAKEFEEEFRKIVKSRREGRKNP